MSDKYIHDYLIIAPRDEHDVGVARDIVAAISAYRIPKGVGASLPGYTDALEDFDENVFFDNADGGDAAVAAETLDSCRAIIVVCSPRTKDNPYILDKLNYLDTNGRRDAIIPVLIEGEPPESMPQFFFSERVIERILKGGSTEKITEIVEPIASDLRNTNKSEYKNKLSYETVRVVAALTGLHPDELEKRHERRRKQRFAMLALSIGGASVIAAVIFLFLGFTAYNEGNIAKEQTAASAKTVDRIITELPQEAVKIEGASKVVDEAIIDSLDALVANDSANLKNVNTDNILKINDDDAASVVLKKASILRRLGDATAAELAYKAALDRSSLLSENEEIYESAYRYALSSDAERTHCVALVLDYDSDVSPIARGEIITALGDVDFEQYRDYSSIVSEMVPGSVIEAKLSTRTQRVTYEQLKLLVYVVL